MSLQDGDDFQPDLECRTFQTGPLTFLVPVDVIDTCGEDFSIGYDERTRLPRVQAAKGPTPA